MNFFGLKSQELDNPAAHPHQEYPGVLNPVDFPYHPSDVPR